MHLDLICLFFLSDCSLIIAMLNNSLGLQKYAPVGGGWGGKDEEVGNGQPEGLGTAAKEDSRLPGPGDGICSGPLLLWLYPPKDGMTV